ncbi:MAG: protease inhibitor I42 family protein [Pseudomonadota bacterium]
MSAMMKKMALVLCLAVCSAGCDADSVQVGENDAGHQIKLAVAQELVVDLASNPSTGYTWSFQLTPEGVIAANGSAYTPKAPQLLGSGGRERFHFIAVKSGQATLRFDCRRPWETDRPPAQSATYDVVVE